MMFMIPIPPTSSDTAATAASSSPRIDAVADAACAMSARLRTEKSSGWPATMRWRCSSSEVISLWAESMCAPSTAETISSLMVVPPVSRSSAEVYGISTVSS